MGAINNNTWNQLTNSRTAPAADFGNCNALILRCAQPKCASGGCASMDIAYPIVSGCVMANDSCKKHGDALIQTIAAQMVAASVAKANEQAAAAQAAAAAQNAAQSEAQYQQMQMQMQQMQAQMSQQNAQQVAQLQAALEEQKQIATQAANEAAAREAAARTAAVETTVATSVIEAAEKGVSADVLARQQASGQILDNLDKAQISLNALKKTMQNAFDYAGCDANGNNCSGPKRVKVFKQKANEFFDPYENVLDEVYDALIMAQSLGVDITDIYMMLNGSCNVWGKYLCTNHPADGKASEMHYTNVNCDRTSGFSKADRNVLGGQKCAVGQVIPMSGGGCQLIQMLNNNEEVQQNWLYPENGENSNVRVGCASEALENSMLFRGRKKQASIDIETLKRIIDQDAPTRISQTEINRFGPAAVTRFCSVNDDDIYKLQVLAQKKTLTTTGLGKICIEDRGYNLEPTAISGVLTITAQSCEDTYKYEGEGAETEEARNTRIKQIENCRNEFKEKQKKCDKSFGKWDESKQECVSCQSELQGVVGGECVDIAKRTTFIEYDKR
jgi:hypothetical protein